MPDSVITHMSVPGVYQLSIIQVSTDWLGYTACILTECMPLYGTTVSNTHSGTIQWHTVAYTQSVYSVYSLSMLTY